MEIKVVREKLNQTMQTPEDNVKYQAFINAYTMLLDEVKINEDTSNLAIDAIDLDQGANFLDTFISLDKKQIKDAWQIIRKCEAFIKNDDYKALKLMCSFAASALDGDEKTANILGNILTAIVFTLKLPKQDVISQDVYMILEQYLLEMLINDVNLPRWNKIKMMPENALNFCITMMNVFEIPIVKDKGSKIPSLFEFKKWILSGKAYAEEAKELKEREKNKPVKKSDELLKLVEHFKNLEDELDKSILENSRFTIENKNIKEQLDVSEKERRELEKRIKSLESEIDNLQSKISKANREVEERKKLNDVQVQYREDSQASLLQDIARALKAEYGDYVETKESPMNEMLGEIYREKIKQIFKILEQKGIKVEI